MPAFSVSRSIHIDAPIEKVHGLVRDFRHWPAWSPWLIAEPDARVTFAPDGSGYSWDGRITGSGEMSVVSENAPTLIGCTLTFLKPWKSTNSVGLALAESEGGTHLTWSMDGKLPWFMFWMKSMMTAFVGSDFQRGLLMLKDLAESGGVPSKLDFPGIREVAARRYIGITTECPIAGIGPHMQKDFARLGEWLGRSGLQPSGPAFSICPKWDPVKGITRYTACIPLDEVPSNHPFESGELAAGRAYLVRHTGPYRHLGNAWAAGMMHARAKVFPSSRSAPPFEVYENDPAETPDHALVTLVHLPAR